MTLADNFDEVERSKDFKKEPFKVFTRFDD